MSADKRALDDLDALFRTVPSKGNTLSRPNKKLRNGGMPGSSLSSSKVAKTAAVGSAAKRKRATEPPEQGEDAGRLSLRNGIGAVHMSPH